MEEKGLAPVENTPDIKFLQYWWKIVVENSENYTFGDAKVEHLEGGKCRITFKLINKEDSSEEFHFVNIGSNGFVSLGTSTKTEEGEVEEDKMTFKNMVGTVIYNFLFFVDKIRGKVV